MEMIVMCPVCKSNLIKKQNSYICDHNHNFDIAKEGYVNLLMCDTKNSKTPGDSKEMLVARKEFLNGGFYEPLLYKIIELIKCSIIPDANIVEAGCGEGYYISGIKDQLPDYNCYGFDISKEAIKLASKRNHNVSFYVSSSYKSNIKYNIVDCLLVIFAPFVEKEFYNMIAPNGIVIVVRPTKNHLLELKKCFYENVNEDKQPLYDKFKVIKSYNVSYDINPDTNDVINLFKMTPFYHQVGQKTQQDFIQNPPKGSIKVDFLIEVLKK